jgi:hypothetical protein
MSDYDDAYYLFERNVRLPLADVRFEHEWVSLAEIEKSKLGKSLLNIWHFG